LTIPAPTPAAELSPIAGNLMPIQRAEELLATLPGVISARIMATPAGVVEEIHVLTTDGIAAKQTVRNIESALIAHLGMRVNHKKISVATSSDAHRPAQVRPSEQRAAVAEPAVEAPATPPSTAAVPATPAQAAPVVPVVPAAPSAPVAPAVPAAETAPAPGAAAAPGPEIAVPAGSPAPASAPALNAETMTVAEMNRRRLYFEDVEVRRSRSKGVACRVTLRKAGVTYVGEAEGLENERLRIELAARAAVMAICQAESEDRVLSLEGCKAIVAFDRNFVFVGVSARVGRESALLTGSAEVKESAETASVLAVLDATNRWIELAR